MVSRLSALEEESIEYFVSFVLILGLPKSIGQIYGLLFVSIEPLSMDDVIDRLEISKGSASQGLSTLKGLGAIVPIEVEGDRREHYGADLDVSRIVNHFIEMRLQPRLSNGEARLDKMIHMATQSNKLTGDNETLKRIRSLKKWQGRGNRAVPFVKRILLSDK